jgi:4-hydroxybenzoyl-CoA thioesterase/acyl-CoA thioester hydrolase
MNPSFHVQRRVEFCETDAAGIAHFAAFFAYMEQAEHSLLRHLGLSVVSRDAEGAISWPRVSAQCNYTAAVRFEDVLDVAVGVERLGETSVTYAFEFTLNGRPVASGSITAVCCRFPPGEPPRSMPIPDWMAERLRTYAIPAAARR